MKLFRRRILHLAIGGRSPWRLPLARTFLGLTFLAAFGWVGSDLRAQPLREQVRGKYHVWIAESDTDRHVIRKIIKGALLKDNPPLELDDFAGQLIGKWLAANSGSDSFVQILPELVQFLIWDAKKPPFTMRSPGVSSLSDLICT
ncbi:MAG: hypothetical protein ACLP19_18910 [Xanthobacteraceae bacterium]